jgi:hypothetical protein
MCWGWIVGAVFRRTVLVTWLEGGGIAGETLKLLKLASVPDTDLSNELQSHLCSDRQSWR